MVEVHTGGDELDPARDSLPTKAEVGGPTGVGVANDRDFVLIEELRQGDEEAFTALTARHADAMFRFACLYTNDVAAAEDAVQDAWIGFLRGISRFEGRSSLRTWLFRILLNRLRTRIRKEGRFVPFSSLVKDSAHWEPALSAERFLAADHPRWPHHWKTPPRSWGDSPEDRLLGEETRLVIDRALADLPPAQREVATLRDIEGWSTREVCDVLRISESNQRVLLHRARSKIRAALEDYLTHG